MKINTFIYNLLSIKGIGRVKVNKILPLIKPYINNNQIEYSEIEHILIKNIKNEQLLEFLNKENELIVDENVNFLNIIDSNYPLLLKDLKLNSPPILTYIGNIDLLNSKKIGFCGSRKSSEKGLNIAKDISEQVVNKKITVVSGYASGIDQQTHFYSLKSGGNTIIILPNGINHFKIKKFIKDVWDWSRILVISEFKPNEIWTVSRAMQRNSTIISLSNVMVLIEAKAKGGSIDAGYKALELNKPLFAPVYYGMPIEAKGNEIMLKKGALPLKRNRHTNRTNLKKIFEIIDKDNNKKELF